jgi:hypothetical protein
MVQKFKTKTLMYYKKQGINLFFKIIKYCKDLFNKTKNTTWVNNQYIQLGNFYSFLNKIHKWKNKQVYIVLMNSAFPI